MTDAGPVAPLTPLEIATGIVHGSTAAPAVEQVRSSRSPLEALESACLRALRRSPCLVSFSGGLDSSLVLAVATRVARREGLPLPVPVTNRFPLVDHAQEDRWQELVTRHLGIDDWIRLDFTDELDAVGPVATRALRRHGVLWPFNAHFHVPVVERAVGGSVLTGIGGDEVFGRSRWARATAFLHGQVGATPRDLARMSFLAAPGWMKRVVLARRMPAVLPWLTEDAHREFARQWAADEADEPAYLGPRLRALDRRRWLRLGLRSLNLLAEDAQAEIRHPLLARDFRVALAQAAPRRGYDDRVAAFRELFADLLPAKLLERGSKARFEGAFWGAPSRELASSWDGQGVDPSVVDREALRVHWELPEPDAHSFLLLQTLWLRHQSVTGVEKGPIGLSASSADGPPLVHSLQNEPVPSLEIDPCT